MSDSRYTPKTDADRQRYAEAGRTRAYIRLIARLDGKAQAMDTHAVHGPQPKPKAGK